MSGHAPGVISEQAAGVAIAALFVIAAIWLLLSARDGAWFGRFLDRTNWGRVHRIWLALIAAGSVGLALGGASAEVVAGFAVVALLLTGPVGDLVITGRFRRRMRGDDDP